MRRTVSKVAILGCAWLAAACGESDETSGGGGLPANADDARKTYASIVHASYEDSLSEAQELDAAVQALVAAPSDATLGAARQAWLAAREPYLQTEVYRFYDGPIDNPVDGPEGLVNAWPLDEAYIDYVDGDPGAGIVNDPQVTIDAATLESLNEMGGEENIATGFHAVEFLLWGQDLSDTGPGARPHTDYVDGAGPNATRRSGYLTTVSGMLVGHLSGLVGAWSPGASDNYRAELESVKPEEAIRRILTGMIVLSGFETGGERLQTALDSGDQEDEHSCFSDNTHRDMVQDIQGVSNVWHGNYQRLDGTSVSGVGVRAVVEQVDADLTVQLDAKIAESLQLANALVPPFDREIALDNPEGRARVEALVTSLGAQEKLLEDVFRKLGLSVPASP